MIYEIGSYWFKQWSKPRDVRETCHMINITETVNGLFCCSYTDRVHPSCMHILKMARLYGSQWQNCKLNIFANILFFDQAKPTEMDKLMHQHSTIPGHPITFVPWEREGTHWGKGRTMGLHKVIRPPLPWEMDGNYQLSFKTTLSS